MWLSLEILASDVPLSVKRGFKNLDITVTGSSPPISHRGSSSIWQPEFDKLGGTLFHLGDPVNIKVRQDRYYLYDAFDLDASDRQFVKFLPKYQRDFEFIVRAIMSRSKVGRIFVTTDVWLGPKPVRYRRPIGLDKFLEASRVRGIRRNSLREVVS